MDSVSVELKACSLVKDLDCTHQTDFVTYTKKHSNNYYQRLEFRMGIIVMLPRMYITGQSEGDPQQLIILALLLENFQVENYQVNQYREEINKILDLKLAEESHDTMAIGLSCCCCWLPSGRHPRKKWIQNSK